MESIPPTNMNTVEPPLQVLDIGEVEEKRGERGGGEE